MQYTDNQVYIIISNNIKLFRIQESLTQIELAQKANISLSYLSKIESKGCDKTFSISVLNQLANALNHDIIDFFKENTASMRQVDIIIKVLKNLGGTGEYSKIYREYDKVTGVQLTAGRKAGIRKVIEDYSSDSDNYKGKEDYFYSVLGKGRGVWGLR